MKNWQAFREIKSWKIPLHVIEAYFAKIYFKILPRTNIIAISGSVGKTLTQNAIYSVLCQKYPTVVGNENLDPTFRIPKTILKARPWHKYIVLEYGVEHPGDMDYYLWIAKPNMAVITNIAKTHTLYFKNESGVFREKVKLIKSLSLQDTAVLNSDDPLVVSMKNKTKAKIIWFGEKANAGINISKFSQNLNGSKFEMSFTGQKISVSWPIIGKHQLLSAYAAATVGIICGLNLKEIASGLSHTKVPLHRLNLIKFKNLNIIDDTYNSSPQAAWQSLMTLDDLGAGKTKIAVLGEMKDLGELSTLAHKDIGAKIAKTKIDYLITIGLVAKKMEIGAKTNNFSGACINVSSTAQAIREVKKITKGNSLILIKGSRHAHLERIVYTLLGKDSTIQCYHCGLLT